MTKVEASKQPKKGVPHKKKKDPLNIETFTSHLSISTKERGGKPNKTSSLEEPSLQ
jgi:hypothetical protein